MTSPDLDGVLRVALSTPITSAQRATLDARIRARLDRPDRPSHHLRPRTAALVLASLLVAAPAVFVVSAALRSTESPNGLESAAAFQAEIDAAERDVPLPAGATWPATIGATDETGSYATGGGRSSVEFSAFCAWSTEWLAASGADAAAAAKVITAAPMWEFYTGVFSSDSLRSVVDGVVASVKGGNPEPVRSFVGANCEG